MLVVPVDWKLRFENHTTTQILYIHDPSKVQSGFSSYFSETNNNLFITCHFFPEKRVSLAFTDQDKHIYNFHER